MMTISAEDQALLNKARQLVQSEKNPSTAFLQRKLHLSFGKASTLMQKLEGDIVTPPDATGWRAMAGTGTLSPDDPRNQGEPSSIEETHQSSDRVERAIGALLGLAVGDAIGTTLEFVPRHRIIKPLTDMVGGGPFKLKPGQWTDDTSMALCLSESLLTHGFDMHDQLKRYLNWYDNGYLSSTGTCFDIGGTTANALEHYRETGDSHAGSTDPDDAGNGCIMRLAPVVIYFQDEPAAAIHYAKKQSQTTHGAPECLMACQLMADIMLRALQGLSKPEVLAPSTLPLDWTPGLRAIADANYLHKTVDDIHGTGYVVQSLEAALWCFAHTNSYAECVLAAANLGDDADTTGAVAGQIAGAFYRVSGIPNTWQEHVFMHKKIQRMAFRLTRRTTETKQSSNSDQKEI